MQPAQTFVNKPTDHARCLTKLGVPQPPHYTIGVKRVRVYRQSECGMHGLSNILKLQATFLYSIFHQRAGKTIISFIWEGVNFTLGIRYVPINPVLLTGSRNTRQRSWTCPHARVCRLFFSASSSFTPSLINLSKSSCWRYLFLSWACFQNQTKEALSPTVVCLLSQVIIW